MWGAGWGEKVKILITFIFDRTPLWKTNWANAQKWTADPFLCFIIIFLIGPGWPRGGGGAQLHCCAKPHLCPGQIVLKAQGKILWGR